MTEDASRRELVVERLVREADGVVSLTLVAPDGAPLPAWEPGAHLDLHLADGLTRQYSLCGAPDDAGRWRVAVLREPAGRGGSAWVHDRVRAGDRIAVTGPRNAFRLRAAPHYLFVAGGIGVTPLLAMARHVAGSGARWTFVYGGRSRASMAFVEELTALAEADADGALVLVPQDECGLIPLAEHLAALPAEAAVYCCGPEPLLEAVEKACAAAGHAPAHVERFAARAAQGGDEREFTLVLARSGARYRVPAGRSIVQVLEEHGVPVLFSCLEGVCGTCEQRIVSGRAQHRDSLLDEQERAENSFLMICVSRAEGDELEIDL